VRHRPTWRPLKSTGKGWWQSFARRIHPVKNGLMTDFTTARATDYRELATALSHALHLEVPPIAIAFTDKVPAGVPNFDEPMSDPTPDGRTGRVAAGCVFWIKAAEHSFTTVPDDHGNCSVGRYTHGLVSMTDIADSADIAALFESEWVDVEAVGAIPVISERAEVITYSPLADASIAPDVVLLRVNGWQLMILSDALPGLRIEGKPQCQIVALAKEHGEVAASVGCALSRARTGMRPDEMTFAMPGARLAEVVKAVQRVAAVDTVVAQYAAEGAQSFTTGT
jgi:uncharacterized protein (DUF169 family)